MKLKVFQKGLILVGVPLLLGLLLIVLLWTLLYQSEQERAREVTYRRGAVLMARLTALTAEVPLLLVASVEYKSEKLYKSYKNNIALIEKYTEQVNEVRRQCPEIQVEFKDELQRVQSELIAVCEKFAERRHSRYVVDQIMKFSKDINLVATRSTGKLNEMAKHGEIQTAITRKKQENIRQLQSEILLGGFVLNLLAGLILSIFYKASILDRLQVITANAHALSCGAGMQELKGDDEIALVDKSFHAMQKQLQAASEREKSLFENASDVICVLDEQNYFLRVSPVCMLYWGYSPEDLIGKHISVLLSDEEKTNCLQDLERSRQSAEPLGVDCRVLCADGSMKEMLWSIYWSKAECSLFCIVHDLTEQKQIERKKAQFLELVSSDLQKPLASISTTLKELINPERCALSQQALDKMKTTSTNLQRLVDLVNDLLQVSKQEELRLELRREFVNVEQIVRQAVHDVEALAAQKEISLELAITDASCTLDANRIVQVLVNLLSNAIKFSPAGSKVRIAASRQGDCFECKVIDNGRGVPESQQATIFEKFSQVELSDGKRQAGTGLGLPICKQIIEEHGGVIGLTSKPGQGSAFWFRIPTGAQTAECEPESRIHVISEDNQEKREIETRRTFLSTVFKQASNISLRTKGMILVGLPVVCELTLVVTLSMTLMQVDRQRNLELHERLISNNANSWMIDSINAFVRMAHECSDLDWDLIQKDMQKARQARKILLKLAADDPRQLAFIKKAAESFNEIEAAAKVAGEAVKENRAVFLPYSERHAVVPVLLKMFYTLEKVIDSAEKKELASPVKEKELRRQQTLLLLAGLTANIVSSVLLAVYFSKDINSRLMVLADNANRLARDQKLNDRLNGSDEIANLDDAFHVTAQALSVARQKERAIFDNSQDIIAVLSPEGKFLSINPACFLLWGYTKEELLKEKPVFDLIFSGDLETTKNLLLTQDSQEERLSFENRIVKHDGSLATMSWMCTKKPGDPLLYCIARDISAKKELEQLKHDFLAMVSHDLRSPLTAIFGNTQLIVKGAFGKVENRDAELLSVISRECHGLVNLIGDLLDIEKLEAGMMTMHMEEIELSDLFKKAIASCLEKARVKLQYSVELDETVLNTDMDRMSQSLSNIIDFALSQSEGTVLIKASNQQSSFCKITVSAPGSPLSEETRQTVFSREGKILSGAIVSGKSYSRLGMVLSQKIIEASGGKACVEVTDKGNDFQIFLPREKTIDED